MWVTRNKKGYLQLFSSKPVRCVEEGAWLLSHKELENGEFLCDLFAIDIFPNLTWEDEPEEVEITMKNYLYKQTCPYCKKTIKFHHKDIKYDYDEQPCSSGYVDETRYISCPNCGQYITLD